MSSSEWAQSQLAEIELLTSMFPGREEMELTDQLALAELRDYVEGSASAVSPPPSRPQFLIKQRLDTVRHGDGNRITLPRRVTLIQT